MNAKLVLGSPFSDHMVLQRGRPNTLWGWDAPARSVRVTLEGAGLHFDVSVTADASGAFSCELPELFLKGPYRLRVTGSSELSIEDVLAGEVWLASGQSNMEWPVSLSLAPELEIAAANYPEIRLLCVPQVAAKHPAKIARCGWSPVSPDTAREMSAVAYAFAREIHAELGVPVGILCAAWGGTRVEAWTSTEALGRVLSLEQERVLYERAPEEIERLAVEHGARLLAWERDNLPADPGNRGKSQGFAEPEFDDSDWQTLTVPGTWQASGLRFNGVVWFRKSIELPADWVGEDLVINLGAIDDFDHTYFNGHLIGAHPKGTPNAFRIHRRYVVPAGLVRPGRNVLSVRVFDHAGEGGLVGPAAEIFLENPKRPAARLLLTGPYRIAVEHEIPLVPEQVFATSPATPEPLQPQNAAGALYNGMLAPLVPFGIAGMIFYQGESNVGNSDSYAVRLTAMIRDLRTRFRQGQFPFYYVELAGYRADDGWPRLREAQAKVLSEPATEMASALDIGDPDDIHPRNKREVGRRLAAIALNHSYGRAGVVAMGPRVSRLEIRGRQCTVHFDSEHGLRSRDGQALRGFELAGVDLVFSSASARIEASSVVLESDEVTAPAAVRYAFRDYVDVNLVNASGLPARPFRSDGA